MSLSRQLPWESLTLLFFNRQKEVWILPEFKVENESTASFPEVKIVLVFCQLQVQLVRSSTNIPSKDAELIPDLVHYYLEWEVI